MNISICITVLNEEATISKLLDSLLTQSRKPDTIIIVDGGSSDRTVEIIRHYQHKDSRIKLLIEKCSRAKGRNLGIEIARSEIVATTDAGCIAQKDWLKNLVEPFKNEEVEVVAGFYTMQGFNPCSRAMSIFLGTLPRKFDVNFLPSARSMAFRKSIWEKVGGFPENLEGAAEDTVFDLKLVKNEAKIARVKNALVEWGMPKTITDFQLSIYNYAKGDAKSKVLWFPGRGLASHNIKAFSIIIRYLVLLTLLLASIKIGYLFPIWLVLFFAYLFWAYRKIYIEFGDKLTALWGPILQIVSDFSVMSGFISAMTSFSH